MRRRKDVGSLVAIAVIALAVGLGACGGDEEESGGGDSVDTVKIGSIHPLTGALAADGKQMDAAVKQAVEDINAAGGIESLDGAKLEVVAEDSQGEPDVGQAAAQRMVDEGVSALIGTFQSTVTANVATVAARSQVPLVVDVSVADEILGEGNQFAFRIQPNASAMGKFGAQSLAQLAEATGEPVESVAYMHDESDFGTSVLKAFQAEAEAQGIEVARAIPYDPFGTQDFTTAIAQVEGSGADVLAVTGYYPDGLQIAKDARASQPDLKAIYGVANGAYSLPNFPADAGNAGNMIFDSNYHFDATKDRVQEIAAEFEERTGEAITTAAVLSYQAVEVVAEALEAAESSDPVELRDAIAGISISDPLLTFPGPIEFGEDGENANARPTLMQVQSGEIVQVLPEEVAQKEPVFPGTPWSR
jgi:branched-chain amino acid transport system substrate-binding protein